MCIVMCVVFCAMDTYFTFIVAPVHVDN